MNLLRQHVPITVIARWLGHRSFESTIKYLHADPKIEEDATKRTRSIYVPTGRYQLEEHVMAFLASLLLCRKTKKGSERNQTVGYSTRNWG